MEDVGVRAATAARWSMATQAGQVLLQLGVQVALARLLGPETYGVFAIGLIVLTFTSFVSDLGFAWGLIQRSTLTDEDTRFVFTWQLLAGVLAAGMMFVAAPAVAVAVEDPRVVGVVRWLALACVLASAATTSVNLLRRRLDFRRLGLIQISAYAVSYAGVGIPLAVAGMGVAALVSAWLTQAAVTLVAAYAACRHPLRPLFWYDGARAAGGHGAVVFMTNITNWLLNHLDRVVVARVLGASAAGAYTLGANLALMPAGLLLNALQPAFLASGARLEGDIERLRRSYLQVLSTIAVLVAPAFVLLALLAPEIVALLYGRAWEEAGRVLTWLALAMPLYLVWGMSTPVLWNSGRRRLEAGLQAPLFVAAALAMAWIAPRGAAAVAVVAAFVFLSRGIVISTAACRAIAVPARDLARILASSAVLCVAVAAAGRVVLEILPVGVWPLLRPASAALGAMAAYAALGRLFPSLIGPEARAMAARLRRRV